MPNTITITFGADTKDVKKQIDQLPDYYKQALHRMTRDSSSFSEGFGKLFARGDVGERRFHGLVGGMVRDMSSLQGGATGAAGAIATLFERISAGTGAGAVLVAIGVGFERLVSRGEELRKQAAETKKELQDLGRALRLATAGEGFSALANKARDAHKEVRKLADEANKEQEHWIRHAAERARFMIAHPFGSLEDKEAYVQEQSAKARDAAAKAAQQEARYIDLAVQAQEKSAEIARAQLSGRIGEVEQLKLQLEYIEKMALVRELEARDPKAGEEARKALDAEFAARDKLAHAQAEQERRQFQAQTIQNQFTRQQAEIRSHLDMPRQREALAASEVAAAKEAVRAAEIEVREAAKHGEKEQEIAALKLQSAQTAQLNAETEFRLTAAREDQARRDFQAKMVQGQFAQQQVAIQGRMVDLQNSALATSEKQIAIARERVELARSGIEAAQAEVRAAEEQVEAAKKLGDEEKRTAAIRLQSAQTQVMQARNALREAAGGVAEARARQLEAAGREEEMSPQEKAEQQAQRQKQYQGLLRAAARQGIRGSLIDAPQYGEAEYDPLRRFKAVATREEMVRLSAEQGMQGAQQQLEINKALAQAGQKAPETPKAGQLGVLLPTDITKLKPEERQKVEAQIPVMRVIGVKGGTEVAVGLSKESISDLAEQLVKLLKPMQQAAGGAAGGGGGGGGAAPPPQAAQAPAPPMQPGVMPPPAPGAAGRPDVRTPIEKWRDEQAQATQQYYEQQKQATHEFYMGQLNEQEQGAFGRYMQEHPELQGNPNLDYRAIANMQINKERFEQAWPQEQPMQQQPVQAQAQEEEYVSPYEAPELPPQVVTPEYIPKLPKQVIAPEDKRNLFQRINDAVKPLANVLGFKGLFGGKDEDQQDQGVRSYQEGGIAKTPQVARLAEKGPEMVLPLLRLEGPPVNLHREAPKKEELSLAEQAQMVGEAIPPELYGVTGPASIGVEIAKQLVNPGKLQAGELTPRQVVAGYERGGISGGIPRKGDPDYENYAKYKGLVSQEEKEEAFYRERGLPPSEYIQRHREQEEAIENVDWSRSRFGPPPGMVQPPEPQSVLQGNWQQQATPPLTQAGGGSGGGQDGGDIAAAIKEGIGMVMDRYWT